MILMVYPTYNDSVQPQLISLSREFTNEEFIAFVASLADALNAPQGGYEHALMTVAVMERQEGPGWIAAAKFELR